MSGLRIWIAVRRDLDMPPGKMAVQVGHAVASLIHKGGKIVDKYMEASQAKIVVYVANEAQASAVVRECERAFIPVVSIVDAGLTVFNAPTMTAVGFGPSARDDLPGALRCLPLAN